MHSLRRLPGIMAILFYSKSDSPELWRGAIERELPELSFRVWPDVGAPEEIRYALIWKPEPGLLASRPNYRSEKLTQIYL